MTYNAEAQRRYRENPANAEKIAERKRRYLSQEHVREKNREAARKRRIEHPEKAKETARKSYYKNLDVIKERLQQPEIKDKNNKRERDRRFKDPLYVLWRSARTRALAAKDEFTIEVSDLEMPSHCPILGIEINYSSKEDRNSRPSIDRVDNTKGYVKGNVRIISVQANTMKSANTLETLELIRQYIVGER